MCGICGVLNKEKGGVDQKLVKEMNEEIEHRGPDQHGYYFDDNIGLGHRRLSIIDLSERGRQPMKNEQGDVWITLNGEVYNYKEIKEELEKKHRFYSNTDTETIIHAYEEYGDDFIRHIQGMFAFALWDSKNKKLILARDRIGKKPLYYYEDNKRIMFSSEIKSIVRDKSIKKEMDYQALSNFLGMKYVPAPRTMFKNIKKLPPASMLIHHEGRTAIKEYWELPLTKEKIRGDKKEIKKLVKEAIRKRLMSDVPLGVFLSGGIDSSITVGLLKDMVEKPIKTFSVGFNHPTDETKYARIIAEKFGTDHHEMIIEADMIKNLPKIVWHLDEPLADPATLPTYLMSKETKKYVTVVLSGEGGDETFCGYKRYNQMLSLLKNRKYIPAGISKVSKAITSVTPHFKNKKYLEFLEEATPIIKDDVKLYCRLHHWILQEEKNRILKEEIKQKIPNLNEEEGIVRRYFTNNLEMVDKMTNFDFKIWLPDDIMMKVDKTSMAHALEVRTPFLDTELVTYGLKLENESRLGKNILKEAVADILPKEILNRKKHGFNVPIYDWFSTDLKSKTSEMIEYLERERIFNKTYMNKVLEKCKRYRYDTQLWAIYNFGLWHQMFINERKVSELS